jgi:hypothetical protein
MWQRAAYLLRCQPDASTTFGQRQRRLDEPPTGRLPFPVILIELIGQPEVFQMRQEPVWFGTPARLIGEHRVETSDHLSIDGVDEPGVLIDV